MFDHIKALRSASCESKMSFWWSEITRDSKRIVAACEQCQTFKPSHHCGRRLDSRPREKLGVDLLYGGQNYIDVMARLLLPVDRGISRKE